MNKRQRKKAHKKLLDKWMRRYKEQTASAVEHFKQEHKKAIKALAFGVDMGAPEGDIGGIAIVANDNLKDNELFIVDPAELEKSDINVTKEWLKQVERELLKAMGVPSWILTGETPNEEHHSLPPPMP